MRLPKRVPWSSPSELEQVYSWIYASEEDATSKTLAVNRLVAWKASTALPHALEATLSILIVIMQDEHYSNASTLHSSSLVLRQSYSLALIRLVNGLVDPLQQGAYARPISSIATQIGLPLWLVELRHASTHEDLPSLELLREGAREAMSWLLHNYFLPTLSPVNQSTAPSPTLTPLSPLLSQYKQLLKATTRDASLKSRFKSEVMRILRDVERWISEARAAASLVNFDADTQYDEEDEQERWALERLCDALIGRGGLVPVSKRKRPSSLQGLTVPIPQLISLWSPLILHVHSRHPTFPSVLISRITTQLFSSSKTPVDLGTTELVPSNVSAGDPTYDHTLASWALWIVQRWGDDPNGDCERHGIVKEVLLGLSRADSRA
ncbi:Las1-domain-containing protein [Ramaria rubella]|nr:Las1-domain-containing protein [Ramaria rubella]